MSEVHLTFQMITLMDDIAKALIIDPYLNVKVSKVGLIMDVEDIILCPSNFLSTTLKQFTETLNYEKTVETLLTCLNDQIFSIIYEEHLRSHMVRYLKVLDSSNGFLVTKTSQYKGQENQVKIVASKAVSKNTKVDVLCGNYVKISPQEETLLENLNSDFSIMYSLMYKCSTILLGTIAFVNHDCNENSAYYSLKANNVKIITTKNIEIGDEVTVRYSNDFFGPNNESCECKTCENAGSGAFKPKNNNDCRNLNNSSTFQMIPSSEFIDNSIKYKKLIDEHIDDGSLTKKEQRQVSDKRDNAGLAYNNNLYGNLINFLKKSKKFDLENIEAIDPSDITICEIANKIYKEKHKKNNLALLNFMTKYKTSILNDVKNDTTDIIAPEKKNTELYETKLIQVSILHCHEDFFNCIFKCKPLDLKVKNLIFDKIKNETDDINKQKRKLDNYLNLYKIHLQLKSTNIVNTVSTEFLNNDAKTKRPIVILESDKADSNVDLSSHKSYDQKKTCNKVQSKRSLKRTSVIPVSTEFLNNDAKTKRPIVILESDKADSNVDLSSHKSYDQKKTCNKVQSKRSLKRTSVIPVSTEFLNNDAKTKRPIVILESDKADSNVDLSSHKSYDQKKTCNKVQSKRSLKRTSVIPGNDNINNNAASNFIGFHENEICTSEAVSKNYARFLNCYNNDCTSAVSSEAPSCAAIQGLSVQDIKDYSDNSLIHNSSSEVPSNSSSMKDLSMDTINDILGLNGNDAEHFFVEMFIKIVSDANKIFADLLDKEQPQFGHEVGMLNSTRQADIDFEEKLRELWTKMNQFYELNIAIVNNIFVEKFDHSIMQDVCAFLMILTSFGKTETINTWSIKQMQQDFIKRDKLKPYLSIIIKHPILQSWERILKRKMHQEVIK